MFSKSFTWYPEADTRHLGLYMHIPFCIQKCSYCDFHSFSGKESIMADYIDAMIKEIKYYKENFDIKFNTIFAGGGTPALLENKLIEKLFTTIYKMYPREDFSEVTIEANPEILDDNKAKTLVKFVDRISIGAQTFDENSLKKLGRIHDIYAVEKSVACAKNAGFKNINIDLMYAIPGQNTGSVIFDIEKAAALKPQHISFYMLTPYEETPFGKKVSSGEIILPYDRDIEDMYLAGNAFLEANGFERYEISNYAGREFKCAHNLNYWNMGEYIGVGSSAASFFQGKRYVNENNPEEYIKKINLKSDPAVETEIMDEIKFEKEFVMLSLRKSEGINCSLFNKIFKRDFKEGREKNLEKYMKAGFIEEEKDHIKIGVRGTLISNEIIGELF